MPRQDEMKRITEIADSSMRDFEVYGTELSVLDWSQTMNSLYGDGSDHEACPSCGMCVVCGDCATFGCGQ